MQDDAIEIESYDDTPFWPDLDELASIPLEEIERELAEEELRCERMNSWSEAE